ncbi:ATP-dependent helicase [Herbiconiux sp. CPCC 205716]|uniref:ATP-dependent helicase n=1 Tax=Herbiconiux gentiana TaxID=2970912 RepID=A0ABT2GF92_9MICO|nr:ATP-dependent helicase [Herbiconiux gentiana]MCS5714896.1 ATP-dependent helicase [Herbiconiux gentiana]
MSDVLDQFSPATREWFRGAFSGPTAAQVGAWTAVSSGAHALVVAPTGSGKTLASFLWAIDRLATTVRDDTPRKTSVLYVSPLKALAVDVERNLRSPLVGITQTAKRLGAKPPVITVGVRSGDTPAADRRGLAKNPPDILITTPESLFLMLTSSARESLAEVTTVIIDEVHAVAATKRGAHLAVSLDRLDTLLPQPAQRIGLSATVRPREEVARFLAGGRPVTIVAPPSTKKFDLRVIVPVEDMSQIPPAENRSVLEGSAAAASAPEQGSIWPHVEEDIVDRILEHRSSIVFANSRRLAERLTARLNEIYSERLATAQELERGVDAMLEEGVARLLREAGAVVTMPPEEGAASASAPPAQLMGQAGQTEGAELVLARAHHGSVSKEQRAIIEDDLKSGRLRCVVATSSLELGIDMGAVDLVVQVEAPPSVASGLQRVGRAGHQVGEVSKGLLYPKHRADLIHSAVVSLRMSEGLIETLSVPANPLDILAQQTVAACALEPIDVEEWFDVMRRSASFTNLPRSAYEATLDLLSGLYPSDEFAELRPRLVWDRDAGTLTGRPGAQRLAVTSGGTIPDRGLFGVFMVGGEPTDADPSTGTARSAPGRRVGELDEEMVYESRVGDVFALGATSWRIHEITHDRVLVTPAFGQPGRLPFWRGEGIGRPAELGRAIGEFTRSVAAADEQGARELAERAGLDEWAAANLVAFITEQREATGHVPSDRTMVVERFRDELGDWRVVLHSPYGMQVHSPWALAINARIRERFGIDANAVASDDGIVVRLPDTESEPPSAELFLFDPVELEQLVTEEVGGSALFASRFRENAARALLLPRQNPGKRSPLWQQRQRSAQLLEVARKYPSFPIILETVRECLQDVYDLPSLLALARDLDSRRIRVVEVESGEASPFARSLLFGYVASFVYEGDSPLAERRAAALALDPSLLSELLGRAELRELLDPSVIDDTERELQRLAPDRRARDLEGVADLLRMLGPLTTAEVTARSQEFDVTAALTELVAAKRALPVTFAGRSQWASIEDAGRLRDALGVPIPFGVPDAFIAPVEHPVIDLVSRYARTHGPFLAHEVAARFGLGVAVVTDALRRLSADRRVVEGEFRPTGSGPVVVADAGAGGSGSGGEGSVGAGGSGAGLGGVGAGDAAADAGGSLAVLDGDPPAVLPALGQAGGTEWCDAEVLRRLRSRSLAALRHEVEPVGTQTLARFLPSWQHVGGSLRGVDGVLTVIEQLAGVPVPASAWENLVLPARVRDYSPAMLDELTASGEVVWSGRGSLPGSDGWVAFHTLDTLPLSATPPEPFDETPVHAAVLAALSRGGAYFFRSLADEVGAAILRGASAPDDASAADTAESAPRPASSALVVPPTDQAVVDAIWDLVWAGLVTNDTVAPLRTLTGSGKAAHATKRPAARSRMYRGRGIARASMQTRVGPPTAGGRWSLLPEPVGDATLRAHGTAEMLLDRYGLVTRGSVMNERVPGGFALVYRVLSQFEESGRCRRGYFVETLGAAQFATGGTIDRLRGFAPDAVGRDSGRDRPPEAMTLAATDPANPFGAALPWPTVEGHKPGRKAGALVVLVDGELTLYLERGGKTALAFSDSEEVLAVATRSLAQAVTTGRVDKLAVERVNGDFVLGTTVGGALEAAGFTGTPRGLRLRA